MTDKTKIEWADATVNPMPGCSPVSEACVNCYARAMAVRQKAMGTKGYEDLTDSKGRWTGKTAWLPERMEKVLRWRKPRRIFWNSMGDTFHGANSNEQIAAMFGVMAATPHHTHLVLTKRIERALEWFGWITRISVDNDIWTECHAHALATEPGMDGPIHLKSEEAPGRPWPLPNVHLGVTVENQKRADERIGELLRCPAAVHFVSAEPLLSQIVFGEDTPEGFYDWLTGAVETGTGSVKPDGAPSISQVIVGGESGPGARPTHPSWVRLIRDQCQAAGAAFYFKQWGGWAPCPGEDWHGLGPAGKPPQLVIGSDGKTHGGWLGKVDTEEKEAEGWRTVQRIGKKAAGRELDGKTWEQTP